MTSCAPYFAVLACLMAATGAYASNCESIRSQIEQKVRASGVANPTVTIVDAAASAAGRAVGSCDMGAKKIMYAQGSAGQPGNVTSSRPKRDEALLTECKDGTVQIGGSCKKK